jgi:hypothetical protein
MYECAYINLEGIMVTVLLLNWFLLNKIAFIYHFSPNCRMFPMDAKPSLLNPTGSILVSSPIKPNPLDLPQLQHRAAVIPPMVRFCCEKIKVKIQKTLWAYFFSWIMILIIIFLWWDWGLNSGPYTCFYHLRLEYFARPFHDDIFKVRVVNCDLPE